MISWNFSLFDSATLHSGRFFQLKQFVGGKAVQTVSVLFLPVDEKIVTREQKTKAKQLWYINYVESVSLEFGYKMSKFLACR